MSPLGFDATKLYNFIGVRFKGTPAKVQEQALTWIQVKDKKEIFNDISVRVTTGLGESLCWTNEESCTCGDRFRILPRRGF